MVRRILHFAFLLLLMLGASTRSLASRQPEYYYRWMSLPAEQLLQMGNRYSTDNQAVDSALVCYTIVANRYREGMGDKEREFCARANIGKWYVYFFCFFDYAKSYESLSKAEELVSGFPKETARVYLNFGAMYQTMAEQGKDQKTLRKALDYYKKSFALCLTSGSTDIDMAFSNIVTVSTDLGELSRIKKNYQQYAHLKAPQDNLVHRYALLLYEGNRHLAAHQYAQAEACYRQQDQLMDTSPDYLRYLVVAKINCGKARKLQGDYTSAEQWLNDALHLASSAHMKDAELELYDQLAGVAAARGDVAGDNRYRNRYLALKDTLLNYRQLMSVNEMRFVSSMKRVDEQMEQLEQRRQHQMIAAGVAVGAALLILCFLIIVWRKNKRLQAQNKSLYEKTLSTLRSEEQERKRRETLERELAQSKVEAPQKREKYAYSTLSDDDKQAIAERILRIMETQEEIYSPDFSVERLAELVGSRYKLVSQVINETYEVNFSSFLNEYRIKEACRRMSDKAHYGHLTIEAISQGVGFKARASFVNAFKKFTGLTPSQFLKMANEQS